MITLGLDPSLTGFGWCVHNGDVAGPERVVAKGVLKTKPEDLVYVRFARCRSLVTELLAHYPTIKAVGVESPPFGEGWSEGLFGLFLYVNEALMVARRDVVYFDPLRVKLLAKMDPNVRQGRIDKGDMVDLARQDTGVTKWNHNEADAYVIARSAARFWDLHAGHIEFDDLTPAELQVFASEHKFVRGKKAGKTIQKGVLFKPDDRYFQFSVLAPQDLSVTLEARP
jgi:hypothetical protein